MDSLELIGLAIYVFCGNSANSYLKYHLLNQRVEIYRDTGTHIMSKIIWGLFLGWATIPIAILHYMIFNGGKD